MIKSFLKDNELKLVDVFFELFVAFFFSMYFAVAKEMRLVTACVCFGVAISFLFISVRDIILLDYKSLFEKKENKKISGYKVVYSELKFVGEPEGVFDEMILDANDIGDALMKFKNEKPNAYVDSIYKVEV